MIPQDTIQQIIQAADVVEVIGDYVSLKKRGANMIACCPFHNEKTPSFYVSPVKQIYKCFGCGKAGDSVRFVMDIDGLSYPEALRSLAKKYGIEVKEREVTDEEQLAQNEKESLHIVLEFAKNYYAKQLFDTEEGQSIGLSYFKERGFNQQTLRNFDLGYSPDGWDTFTRHALASGYSLELLEKAGLTIQKEGKEPIDRFRGRVIFPIHNVSGKAIAFGARILKKDPKAPKYLNSPETAVYHKSYIVYGINHAKTAIRNEENCFLVEGYTDVVSMHQAGVENVVASSGTSLTKEQIQLIRRFTNNITVLYDGDAAGIRASIRGIDLILEEGMNVKVVVFPEGDDPDSFVQRIGSKEFKEFIKATEKDFIRFKTELSLQEIGNDPIKRAELIGDLVATVSKIPDAIKRAVFTKEIADLLQIEEQILITEGNKIFKKNTEERERSRNNNYQERTAATGNFPPPPEPISFQPPPSVEQKRTPLSYQEEECMRLLVCYGTYVIERNVIENIDITLADYVFQELKEMEFRTPNYNNLLIIYKEGYQHGEIPSAQFFTSHTDESIQRLAINWLTSKEEISPNWKKFEIHVPDPAEQQELAESAYKNILRLKKARFEDDIQALTNELIHAETPNDQDNIMIKMMQLKAVVKKIADMLGTVVQG
jgi:DNA primase